MARNNKEFRHYRNNSALLPTAGGAGINTQSITTYADLIGLGEGILGIDGARAKIKNMRVHIRAYSIKPFTIQGLFIQTIGTITDTVDIASKITDIIVDSVCNDVFGYQEAFQTKVSKAMTPAAALGSTECNASEFSFNLPANVLQLINKEAETERLQNLYLTFLCNHTANSQAITIKLWLDCEFTEVRKQIVLR